MQQYVRLQEKTQRSKARAYVLLRTVEGCAENAAHVLLQNAGVVVVDRLEGPPDIVVVMEATDRTKLARAVMKALASIEVMTDGVELLPARDGTRLRPSKRSKISESTRHGRRTRKT